MASHWDIEVVGKGRKTAADWQAAELVLSLENLGVDKLTFRTTQSVDDAPICQYGDTVRLWRSTDTGDTKWFEGRRILVPAALEPSSEGQAYTIAGPWQWLSTNVFKMLWRGYVAAVLLQRYSGHILVNTAVQDTVRAVLTYAAANGANLQVGVIDAPVFPPFNEFVDKTCAAVIMEAVQYAPDRVGFFDYSTNPPTFHLRPRAALDAIALAAPPVKVANLQAREDLAVPSVDVTYEITSDVDGQPRMGFVEDVYPLVATGREDGALSVTVSLQGFSATHVRGTLVCQQINTGDIAWWKQFIPELQSPYIRNITIFGVPTRLDHNGGPSLGLPRVLINGQIAPWMLKNDGNPVQFQNEVFGLQVQLEVWSSPILGQGFLLDKVAIHNYTLELVTTDAPDGATDFETLATFETGDPVPLGLAKYLYDSLHPLHYDCSFVLEDEECAQLVKVGNTVNLLGSRAEFAHMAALVQSVQYQIDTGLTRITAGPPRQLSLTDLMALLRANRVRRRWTNPDTVNTGDVSGPSNVELGKATANNNAVGSDLIKKQLTIYDPGSQGRIFLTAETRKIIMDLAQGNTTQILSIDVAEADWVNAPPGSQSLTVRTVKVCVNNETWNMLVIGGAPWKPAS